MTPAPRAEWVTVTAYAHRFGISRATVYKWLDAKLLETYRLRHVLRVRNLPPDQHRLPNRR